MEPAMSTATEDRINKICDEIDNLLDGAAPAADEPRLQRIRFLAGHLKGFDSYMSAEAGRLEIAASTYFSARKHANEPGGPEMLMQRMRHSLLRSIRNQAKLARG